MLKYCPLCGKPLDVNNAQRIVHHGKLVLACWGGRLCYKPEKKPAITSSKMKLVRRLAVRYAL